MNTTRVYMQTATRREIVVTDLKRTRTKGDLEMLSCCFARTGLLVNHRLPSSWVCYNNNSAHMRAFCRSPDGREESEEQDDHTHRPKNPSNQQPTDAGKEGAKSSGDMMFEAYGDKYATRAGGDDAFGERYGAKTVNPFDKNIKGDLAEELGVPELRNRDEVRKKAEVRKEKDTSKKGPEA